MKTSNVVLFTVAAFALGFIAGVLFASFKSDPPGLAGQAASPEAARPGPSPADDHWREELAAITAQLEDAPDEPKLLLNAGNLLFDHGQFKQAVPYYQRALKVMGENPNVLNDIGVAYRRLKQPEKAVEYFRRARKADPGHAPSALNLGITLFHDLNDHEGALEAWEEYLALNPNDPNTQMIRQVVEQLRKDQAK
jgi:tetratricopeptide (TPR) repeat protein